MKKQPKCPFSHRSLHGICHTFIAEQKMFHVFPFWQRASLRPACISTQIAGPSPTGGVNKVSACKAPIMFWVCSPGLPSPACGQLQCHKMILSDLCVWLITNTHSLFAESVSSCSLSADAEMPVFPATTQSSIGLPCCWSLTNSKSMSIVLNSQLGTSDAKLNCSSHALCWKFL